jgi:glycine/D-amino acid oxidase-like deaminating enzyme
MALRSLWWDRNPSATPEPGEVAGEWDVVVVGGGLTGLTTAGLFARAGRSVLVVEARHVGAGTTGGSTAKVSVLQGTRLSSIARKHSDQVLRQYVEANREGLAWLDRFCTEHDVECDARPAYTFARTSRGERSARAELEALHAAGLSDAHWVERPPLPFETAGAVCLPDQRQVDPVSLVAALAEDARRHGATIVEGCRVRQVRGREPVQVETEKHGTLSTALVVVATNMPILDRGGFFARATPSRSYSISFRTETPAVDGMYLSADGPTRSLRDVTDPDGTSLLLVGGDGHRTGSATSEREHLDSLRSWTREHFPYAVETHAWSAQDFISASGLPFVGPVLPGAEHVQVAGGFSKWGFTNGIAAALAIAGRNLGDHQHWAAAYEPWGKHELAGLPSAVKANAEVALEMAEGWVRHLAPGHDEGAGDLSTVCTHLGGIVRWNDAEESWDCPLHGSRFAPDGSVLEAPATCGLRRVR